MRYVEKDLMDIPPSLISSIALNDIEKIALRDTSVNINDSIYKGVYKGSDGKTRSQVRDFLNKYYLLKCAYCEAICKAEIEHYRPKKAISDDAAHNGYYWLCYSWSNLVPSCRYCNTEGGKGNKFPIINASRRVSSPPFSFGKLDIAKCQASASPLLDEEPYLLHPEIDKHPEAYLSFEPSDDKNGVSILGIDDKGRGKKTIEICNLNREDLRLKRLKDVYYHMKHEINRIFEMNADGYIPNDKLSDCLVVLYKGFEKQSTDISLTHTLLRKFLVLNSKNFETFFAPYLDSDSVRKISVETFKVFKP
ncbi:hypothetical protein [Flavobacterium sp. 3HN19-14]|uniref:hypothetical protein n=1 Tax=Flavobacterium sp. 3HN19-14 TaxID=3448133 RepID=UPI003EE35022